jgi:hypothetical protein
MMLLSARVTGDLIGKRRRDVALDHPPVMTYMRRETLKRSPNGFGLVSTVILAGQTIEKAYSPVIQ